MKIISIIFSVLLLCSNVYGQIIVAPVHSNDTPPVTYTYRETCDTATGNGYDNAGMIVQGATVNSNYTTTVLEGTQSCYIDSTSGQSYFLYILPEPMAELEVFAMVKFPSYSLPASSAVFLSFQASGSSKVWARITGGTGVFSVDTANDAASETAISANNTDTFRIWLYYKASTGAVELYVSTNDTKPGSPSATISSTQTESINYITFTNTEPAPAIIVDNICTDNLRITGVCE